MKILHYFLGFPPYRSGGLPKYVVDLMNEQIKNEDEVFALWPGKMDITSHKVKIKKCKKICKINSYELINPLPVPLLNGIQNVEFYTLSCDENVYKNFLEKVKPNVIHIHTLMGIHYEFIKVAKELKIKTVFTTHDYFGICPKVNLLRNDKVCDGNLEFCSDCNKTAFSIKKIKIMQSRTYRMIKTTPLFKYIKKLNSKKSSNNESFSGVSSKNEIEKYDKLRKYYLNILKNIDTIHYNSNVSKQIYEKFYKFENSKVVSITHSSISDNKEKRKYGKKLRISYLGPTKKYKGFYILLDTLDELYDNDNLELNIYYETNETRNYLKKNNKYEYNQLGEVLNNADIVVVPSLWYETFGFTVAEALSYGVPVVVTKNVGAKDILEDGKFGFITDIDSKDISKCIGNILKDRNLLVNVNRNIVNLYNVKTMDKHYDEIKKLYGCD